MNRKTIILLTALLLLPTFLMAQEDVMTREDHASADSLTLISDMDSLLIADTLRLEWPMNVREDIANLLRHPMFQTSQVGLMVYDLTADSVIFKHNERQLMRPASTMKVVTAITAIDCLGGSYQLKTQLRYKGTIDDNTLNGNLYCIGGLDPRFNGDDQQDQQVSGLRRGRV